MSYSLAELEATRNKLLHQFLSLGDFRPGTVSAIPRRCGRPTCHCAQPDDAGHPQFRLLRKVKGKSVAESFASPSAFRKAAQEVAEFHRFAVRQTAREEKVALIDLNAMSAPFYEALGSVESHRAFAGSDTTHHSNYGSYELAKCIVEGIRQTGLPLAKYLVDTPPFDPAHPDAVDQFDVPAEPDARALRPYGQ